MDVSFYPLQESPFTLERAVAGCIQMNQLLFRTFPVFVCPNTFDGDANSSNDVSDSADGRSDDVTASTMTM